MDIIVCHLNKLLLTIFCLIEHLEKEFIEKYINKVKAYYRFKSKSIDRYEHGLRFFLCALIMVTIVKTHWLAYLDKNKHECVDELLLPEAKYEDYTSDTYTSNTSDEEI